jgi:hypothetical protein
LVRSIIAQLTVSWWPAKMATITAPTRTGRLQRFCETAPLHPFLFGFHSVLSLYALNATKLPITDMLALSATVLAAIAAALVLIRWLVGDTMKAAILTSLFVIPIVYFVPLLGLVSSLFGDFASPVAFVALSILPIGGLLWGVRPSKLDLRPIALGLNAAAMIFVGLAGYGLVGKPLAAPTISPEGVARLLDAPANPPGPRRDIYYIILDRYANAETLRDVYDFDNTAFLDRLGELGFFVAANSAANYQRTAHSVASSLNLDYLQNLVPTSGQSGFSWLPIYQMLEKHLAGRFLKQQGYKFIQFGSWWNPTRTSRSADENVNWHTMPQLHRSYLQQTLVGSLTESLGIAAFDERANQCDRIRRQFSRLAELPQDPAPTFVFAHILVPHPPFVFDANGKCLSLEEATARSRTKNYTDQVIFINGMILDLVARIRAASKTEPVIVIQADEGPWPEAYAGDERFFGQDISSVNWAKVPRAELREKMRILNALYLPGQDPAPRYPNMTPVNTFRIIFNRYFGTTLPLLPDKNYVFVDDEHLFTFKDVTDQVQ